MLHMVQMWTPLQVFSNGYVYTDKFQLPLYNGVPNKVNHVILYVAIYLIYSAHGTFLIAYDRFISH